MYDRQALYHCTGSLTIWLWLTDNSIGPQSVLSVMADSNEAWSLDTRCPQPAAGTLWSCAHGKRVFILVPGLEANSAEGPFRTPAVRREGKIM